MANPPFMSPKGGIKPHKKFTMQANRSEVLFVDYIAEHINPTTGRAGIIVPEGIIFQSANAYKQLRQMLVDKKYLCAVVSLPAGIFQPYSGVKTSVLFMDKALAKKTYNILFVKIENDGFDLGAQRKAIDKNDLTAALVHLQEYRDSILNNSPFTSTNKNAFVIDKKVIKGTGDYNLSVDRYRVIENVRQSNFEMVRLGDLCELEYGKPLKEENRINGEYPVFGSNGIVGYHNEYLVQAPFIIVGRKGSAGSLHFSEKNGFPIDTTFYIKIKSEEKILLKFLFQSLLVLDLKNVNTQAGVPGLNRNDAYDLQIPLPPLSIQQQIVSKIESYQAIINGAKQVVENYKPQIEINPDWEMVELGEICEVKAGGTPSRNKDEYWNGNIPWLRSEACKDGFVNEAKEFISKKGYENSSTKYLKPKSTLIALVGATIGKTAFLTFEATTNQNVAGLYPKDENKLQPEFLFHAVKLLYSQFTSLGEFRMANLGLVKAMKIPLPSLSQQQQIVTRIEQEQQLINSNKELIKIFEQKIKDEINKLWQPAVKDYKVEEEKLTVAAEGQH
jgi:type I restriction enzyme M protein